MKAQIIVRLGLVSTWLALLLVNCASKPQAFTGKGPGSQQPYPSQVILKDPDVENPSETPPENPPAFVPPKKDPEPTQTLAPPPAGIYDPFKEIKWTAVKNYGGVQPNGSSHFLDVIGHTSTEPNLNDCKREKGMAFDIDSVRIHETGHMLNCQIRTLEETGYSNDKEGVYYEDGKGMVFSKPPLKITDFADSVSQNLRGQYTPYQLYMVEQPRNFESLNNVAYLFNEWGAYLMNIRMVLELEKAGKPEGESKGHGANHSPYFFGYVAYGMDALRMKNPAALDDKQFKAAFAIYAQYTWDLMRKALDSPVWGSPTTAYGAPIQKTMDFYRTSAEFAHVREGLAAIYGQPWVDFLMK